MGMCHYFLWMIISLGQIAADQTCDIYDVRSLDMYTNITIDRDKCEVLVTTSPGNRSIALIHKYLNVQVYDGNSTVLIPRFYNRYLTSTVSQNNQLIIKQENPYYFFDGIFLLSTGGSSCGYNFTVEHHDIIVKIKGDKCTLFAETSTSNNIVAVSRISDFIYDDCYLAGRCQVVLFYDGNSTNDAPYVIPPMRSFASRGNKIAIQCVHNCEDVHITLYRIAPRQILDVEVRESGQIESPRYPQINEESPFNLQMNWVLISVRLATFKLTFLKFRLTESPQKCLDTLKIESTDGFTEELCGNSATPLEYHMSSNKITMMYIKNSDFPSEGFILRYTACITKIEKTEGMIIVPLFNGSVRCVYKIEVDRGSIIEMNITGIDGNETEGFNCPGRIHVHDGVAPSLELSKISCSYNRPVKVVSTSNVLYTTYLGQGSPVRSTVIARYSFTSVLNRKLNNTRGVIIVPAHNGKTRCVYKIEVEKRSLIELTITGIDRNGTNDFSCHWCLQIHDGASLSAELSSLCCSNDGPVKVESTSNVVYITYTRQSNPERSTVIARYIYKSVYRKYFRRETGIILLPESEVDKTKECQFFVSVSKLKKIRLYFHREHSRIDNDTCSSIMNVTDGDTSSIILYSGCVFSKLPEFGETTSNTMTIIVFLNDQLNTSTPLGFYTAYEATTLPIKKIIIASLGLVILFLTGNLSVWIWMAKKTNTSGRSTSAHRDIVIDNNTVYDIQEENIDNPYEEVE